MAASFISCFVFLIGTGLISAYCASGQLQQSSDLCTDTSDSFHCGDFTCIHWTQICNGVADCAGGSDESPEMCENIVCPLFAFPCGDGRCLYETEVCEESRRHECADGRDEDDSGYCANRRNHTQPHPNNFCPTVMCNGNCVLSEEEMCNGTPYITCANGEDEEEQFCKQRIERGQCINAVEMFFCGTGQCVSKRKLCDGVAHCSNGADEDVETCAAMRDQQPAQCYEYQYTCRDNQTCIYAGSQLCNGNSDCPDGDDESDENCLIHCLEQFDHIKCPRSGKCAWIDDMCTSTYRVPNLCFDSEQQRLAFCRETFNNKSCQDRENSNIKLFDCGDGQCIKVLETCNGWAQCLNSADESKELCNEDFMCFEEHFKCRDRSGKTVCVSQESVCDGKQDCPDGTDENEEMCHTRECDSSFYYPCGDGQCVPFLYVGDGAVINCNNGADETMEIYQARWGLGPGKDKTCPTQDYFACNDIKGQCIRSDFACRQGRRPACISNADKDPELCQSDRQCPLGQVPCGDGQCIHSYAVCDGIYRSCANGWDESLTTCTGRRECASNEFLCADGLHCIPEEYVCNGLVYCVGDESDETDEACQWKANRTNLLLATETILTVTEITDLNTTSDPNMISTTQPAKLRDEGNGASSVITTKIPRSIVLLVCFTVLVLFLPYIVM